MAKNDAALSKGKPAGGMTPENTNLHNQPAQADEDGAAPQV